MSTLLDKIFPPTEQLILVSGAMEMAILPRTKIVMLFVAGEIVDQTPYEDLAAQFRKKGYSMHLFTLPVPKV